jgi:hypothetical protein
MEGMACSGAPMRLLSAPAALSVLLLPTACDGCRGGRTSSAPGPGGRVGAASRAPVTVTLAADPAVPIKNQDASNPFNRLGPYGLQIDLPPASASPDGAVVRNLLSMRSRIVPRTP